MVPRVKVGDGALHEVQLCDARELAEAMIALGRTLAGDVVCELTDMDQPLDTRWGTRSRFRGGCDAPWRRPCRSHPARARVVRAPCRLSDLSASTGTEGRLLCRRAAIARRLAVAAYRSGGCGAGADPDAHLRRAPFIGEAFCRRRRVPPGRRRARRSGSQPPSRRRRRTTMSPSTTQWASSAERSAATLSRRASHSPRSMRATSVRSAGRRSRRRPRTSSGRRAAAGGDRPRDDRCLSSPRSRPNAGSRRGGEGKRIATARIDDARLTRPDDPTSSPRASRAISIATVSAAAVHRRAPGQRPIAPRSPAHDRWVPIPHRGRTKRAVFELDDGTRVAYRDTRRFGTCSSRGRGRRAHPRGEERP